MQNSPSASRLCDGRTPDTGHLKDLPTASTETLFFFSPVAFFTGRMVMKTWTFILCILLNIPCRSINIITKTNSCEALAMNY